VLELRWHDIYRLHVVWRNLAIRAVLTICDHHGVAEPADTPLDHLIRWLFDVFPSNGLEDGVIEAGVPRWAVAVRPDSVSVVKELLLLLVSRTVRVSSVADSAASEISELQSLERLRLSGAEGKLMGVN